MGSSVHPRLRRLLTDHRGEGVISTGIAVLIMALLGAAMWVAFSNLFQTAASDTAENVTCIGDNSCDSAITSGP